MSHAGIDRQVIDPETGRPFGALERYWSDPAWRAQVDADYRRRQADVHDGISCAVERFHAVPHEDRIARVMRELGFDRMQAVNHLRQRDAPAEKLRHNRGR